MKISFSGLETPFEVKVGIVSVLEIQNRHMFTRFCQSLLSGEGEEAIEPYSLWEEEKELKTSEALIIVPNPLVLPWDDKRLASHLIPKLESLLYESERLRGEVERLSQRLSEIVASLCFQVNAEYQFTVEWEVRRYLKAFGFSVEVDSSAPLIDNLIKFLDYCVDMQFKETLLFINLKPFLGENDLEKLYERVFFHKIRIVLLENSAGKDTCENERKLIVDQDFLEVLA